MGSNHSDSQRDYLDWKALEKWQRRDFVWRLIRKKFFTVESSVTKVLKDKVLLSLQSAAVLEVLKLFN